MLSVMSRALRKWSDLEAYDHVELLEMARGYRVRSLLVNPGDWVEGKPLSELKLFDEGVTVLGIHHHDGTYLGAPPRARQPSRSGTASCSTGATNTSRGAGQVASTGRATHRVASPGPRRPPATSARAATLRRGPGRRRCDQVEASLDTSLPGWPPRQDDRSSQAATHADKGVQQIQEASVMRIRRIPHRHVASPSLIFGQDPSQRQSDGRAHRLDHLAYSLL